MMWHDPADSPLDCIARRFGCSRELAEAVLPARHPGWRPEDIADALCVPIHDIRVGGPVVGDLVVISYRGEDMWRLAVYESLGHIYDPADGQTKTIGGLTFWFFIRTSLYGEG